MIFKIGKKYIVKSKSGRTFGTYPFKNKREEEKAEEKAKARLQQMEMFKHLKPIGK